MTAHFPRTRRAWVWSLVLALAPAALLALPGTAVVAPPKPLQLLRIGATGSLTGKADSAEEAAGVELLQGFIKEETSLNNEIAPEKGWVQLMTMLLRGQLHIVVCQGYEYAWAQERYPQLRPLAMAINVYRYPSAHVLVRQDGTAKDLAALQTQTLALPITNQEFVRLYLDRHCAAAGKSLETYFGKILAPENAEDALDEIVDGRAQAAVVDSVAIETYRRRKPGRAGQLKEIARSPSFPPPFVVCYQAGGLDDATLQRFKAGLLNASRQRKGQTLLMLSRLSSFEAITPGFDQVLADTRKAFPADTKSK